MFVIQEFGELRQEDFYKFEGGLAIKQNFVSKPIPGKILVLSQKEKCQAETVHKI